MNKIFKVILWVILAFIIVMILAITGFLLLFNPNHYKTQITHAFYQQTGRQLVLKGDIHWSFYPALSLKLSDVTVNNPAGYVQPVFAHLDAAELNVRLLPLLSKQIEVNRLLVNGLQLTLVQKTPTLNNWTFTAQTPVGDAESVENAREIPGQSTPIALQIQSVKINNASVEYIDLPAHVHGQLKKVMLTASQVNLQKAFPITLAFYVENDAPSIIAKVALQGNLLLNQQQQEYSLMQLSLQVNGALQTTDHKIPLNMDMQGGALIDLLRQQMKAQLTVNVNNATLLTEVKLDFLPDHFQYQGKIQLLPIDFDAILQGFSFSVPVFPSERALSDTSLKVYFSGDNDHLNLTPIAISLDRSKLTGQITIANFSEPAVTFNIRIDQILVEDYVHLHGAKLMLSDLQLMGQLSTKSLQMPALAQTLNGQAQLIVKQSTLKGVDLGALLQHVGDAVNSVFQNGDILSSLNTLQSQLPQFSSGMKINPDNGQKTQFGYFNTQAGVQDGLINNQSIDLTGDDFVINGSGTVDLTQHNVLNYHFNAYNAQLKQTNGQWVQTPGSLQVPLYVQGPMESLTYGIDMNSFLIQLKDLALQHMKNQLLQQAANVVSASGGGGAGEGGASQASQIQQVKQQAQQLLNGVLGQ